MEREEYRNIEEAILQNEETTKRTLKQQTFQKFNYLKYKPANNKTLQGNSKPSHANVLKENINP